MDTRGYVLHIPLHAVAEYPVVRNIYAKVARIHFLKSIETKLSLSRSVFPILLQGNLFLCNVGGAHPRPQTCTEPGS